jgi:hypothetical protein
VHGASSDYRDLLTEKHCLRNIVSYKRNRSGALGNQFEEQFVEAVSQHVIQRCERLIE